MLGVHVHEEIRLDRKRKLGKGSAIARGVKLSSLRMVAGSAKETGLETQERRWLF